MSIAPSCRPPRRLTTPLIMAGWLGMLAAGPAVAQEPATEDAKAPRRESVEIEPYTGPPIYLPKAETPPPPTEVESRVVREKFPDSETLRFERRVVRFSDNSVISDGPHKEFYSSGQVHVEGEYRLGKATGEWTYYHENGQLAKKITYVDGKPDGEIKVYSEEGALVATRTYAEGRRDGVWEQFSADGEQKLREETYANGKADGKFRIWYSNGQLRQEISFADGKREGLATEFSRVGEKRAEVNFKDGLKDGDAKVWQRDGTLIEQTYEAGRLVARSKAG